MTTGREIVGIYKELQKGTETISLVLELTEGNIVQVSFPNGSVEADIVRAALLRVKHNVMLGLTKVNDPKVSLIVRKIYDLSSKKLSLYFDKTSSKRLEKLRAPGEPLKIAIVRALDIIDGRETIVAVIKGDQFRCNKMKAMGEAKRFYCTMLEAPVGERYCLEKCMVADQLNRIQRVVL